MAAFIQDGGVDFSHPRRLVDIAAELGRRGAQSRGETHNILNAYIPSASLNIADEAAVDIGLLGNGLLAEALPFAKGAYVPPERAQHWVQLWH